MPQTNSAIIRSEWNGGFVADVTVGASGSALNGWTVSFDTPFGLVNVWNARVISHVGTRYVLGNLEYNAAVAAGASTGFGFQAAGPSSQLVFVPGTQPATLPRVSIGDATLAEPVLGSALATLTISLDQAAASAVTVNYATANGSATAGSDYTAGSGTVSFAPGQTSKTIAVQVLADRLVEATETVRVTLSGATGASIADGEGVLSILNTGGGAPPPSLAVTDIAVTERGLLTQEKWDEIFTFENLIRPVFMK